MQELGASEQWQVGVLLLGGNAPSEGECKVAAVTLASVAAMKNYRTAPNLAGRESVADMLNVVQQPHRVTAWDTGLEIKGAEQKLMKVESRKLVQMTLMYLEPQPRTWNDLLIVLKQWQNQRSRTRQMLA